MKKILIVGIAIVLVLAIGAIALLSQTASPQGFLHSGEAMLPTYTDGQYLATTTIDRTLQRGDIIVFRYPLDPNVLMVKRIIAIPGDTFELTDGQVTINGSPEQTSTIIGPTEGNLSENLRDGEYFVIGDNRPKSSDSRIWGVLSRENVLWLVE